VASRNAAGAAGWHVPNDDALAAVLDGVTAVLVDGHHLPVGVAVAAAARSRGIPVVLDAGSWKRGLEVLLAHVDVLVASADFRSPAGTSLPELLALGPWWVARSAGSEPVRWLAADGSSGEVPVPVVDVVDTLGAGDVLHGALLTDIGRRGTDDLPASLELAVGVAARSVGAPGARGWARPTP
jgi:sugar/nucleoside kinase (ribokinase family)